ncbi:MAG: CbrC family protein [Phycisphaeraceae bacterium]|nr:CbrC family protein [Phycisphaeraceae bacterium]
MEALPHFPLFRDPVKEQSFKESDEECECCGRSRGWIYSRSIYVSQGDGDISICPWCIADGSASAKFDGTFQSAGIHPYGKNLLSPEDVELVEKRTPGFVTWQDHGWMMCCGIACEYIGEARAEDLRGRWAAAVPSIFSDDSWSEKEIEELVSRMGTDPAAYVFECRKCGKLLGFWDCS